MKKIIIALIFIALSFNLASADYKRNINDEIKVYKVEKKVEKILNKYSVEQQKKIKEIVKRKIENILGMSKNEIYKINNFGERNIFKINSFKDYLLLRIYKDLNYGQYIGFKGYKVINTNFARVLVYLYNNNESLAVSSDGFFLEGNKYQFFYLPKGFKTESYLENKFLDKKYIGKCKVENLGNNKFRFIPFGEYMKGKHPLEMEGACGFRAYSNFQKISENVLMYAEFGQDWNGVDLATIEVKQNINLDQDEIINFFGEKDPRFGNIEGVFIIRKRGKNAFLYDGKKIIYFYRIGYQNIIDIQKGKSGIYLLIKLEGGYDSLIMINNGNIRKLIKGEANIKNFELMTNKRVKLFYSGLDGISEKIIKIK